jgi:AcrR family transcriptional regulator
VVIIGLPHHNKGFQTERDQTTRERLLNAGIRLFADRGFRGTTVGEIEAAAGLTPRSGGLYKHFGSKRELLAAAVERHIHELQTIGNVMDLMPLGDLRAELTLLIRWLLGQLQGERELCLVLEKDGDQLPELRDRFYQEVVDVGYHLAVEYARRLVKEEPQLAELDVEAVAAIAVGAAVNHRRSEWTFGRTPLDLDDERFVAGTVDLLMRVVDLKKAEE